MNQYEGKKMTFKVTDEQKKNMKDAIHAYYLDERGEDIGIIHQEGIYNLFMEELAPIIYNKALDDAKYWLARRMNDIDSDYYELYKEIR